MQMPDDFPRPLGGTPDSAEQQPLDKSQAYFWTEEWQKGEAEAEADIKAGRIKTFDFVEELLEDLDR
jgi:hypothetical protein